VLSTWISAFEAIAAFRVWYERRASKVDEVVDELD
jgi:hypothetical protein